MIISNKHIRQQYKDATKISTEILRQMYDATVPGKYPVEIDELAGKLCKQYQVEPSFYHVRGRTGIYGYSSCIYTNDVVVHGIPSKKVALKEGDLVTLDFGIIYEGLHTDQAVTVGLASVSSADKKLLENGRRTVYEATEFAVAGNTTGDIGHALQHGASRDNFFTVREYVGHGIGKHLHESPEVPAYGVSGTGRILEEDMVICVEAQVVAGKPNLTHSQDGWTVKTKDGKKSVMFEYMVVVGKHEPTILTRTEEWELEK